tara:strand:+ start:191 stop:751 length:561 start_codon:yes stop_codon:yes gene_type:complete
MDIPTTMDEFGKLYSLDIESIGGFERTVTTGTLSLDLELGVILSVLRFSNHDLETESQSDEIYNWDWFEEAVHQLNRYEITMKSPACFIQGAKELGFSQFIQEWFQHQGENHRWNPDYAPSISLNPAVEKYCREHDPRDILKEFNLAPPAYIGNPESWRVSSEPNFVLYPFTGWELARCLELGYSE